jgi:hypothetical protein
MAGRFLMSEQNQFFRWLYRLLALGALGLLLVIAYAIIAGELSSRRWQHRNTVAVQQPTADGQKKVQELRFGDLELIRGSAIRMIKVESEVDRGKRLGLSSGGYGWNFRTRNLVFVQPGSSSPARWLFKGDGQYLSDIDQLCICRDGVKSPALALYFEIAQGDGSGRPEGVSPAVTHADGSGYATLGKPVARVLDKDVSEDGKTLGLLVEDQGKLVYRQFSLETFAPLQEQLVTQLQRE